jgi:hypothetical protein
MLGVHLCEFAWTASSGYRRAQSNAATRQFPALIVDGMCGPPGTLM